MSTRVAGALIGVVFGVALCWSGMTDPDVIRGALLFEDAYLFGMFASAVVTAAVGVRVARWWRGRAVLTGEPVCWTPEPVTRRHVTGALIFGTGWGVSHVCPGPIAAQIGLGIPWALLTLAGALGGIWLYQRRGGLETEPPSDTPAPVAEPAPAAA